MAPSVSPSHEASPTPAVANPATVSRKPYLRIIVPLALLAVVILGLYAGETTLVMLLVAVVIGVAIAVPLYRNVRWLFTGSEKLSVEDVLRSLPDGDVALRELIERSGRLSGVLNATPDNMICTAAVRID